MSIVRRFVPVYVALLLAIAAGTAPADTDPYLPNNADTVVIVNLKQMLESPVLANHHETVRQTLKTLGNADKTLEELGVDVFKDVDRLILAKEENASLDKITIIVRGRFDPKKMREKATQQSRDKPEQFKLHAAGDYRILEAKLPPMTIPILPPTLFTCVLDKNVVIAAPTKEGVLDAIAKKEERKKAEQKKAFADLLAKADPKQSVTIVSNANMGNGPLGTITTITGGVTVNNEIKTNLVLGTKDVESANEMVELIEDLRNQAKALISVLGGKESPKEVAIFVEMLGSMVIRVEGGNVQIKGEISKEFVDKTLK